MMQVPFCRIVPTEKANAAALCILDSFFGELSVRNEPAFVELLPAAVGKLCSVEIIKSGLYVKNYFYITLVRELMMIFCFHHHKLLIIPEDHIHFVVNAFSLHCLVCKY